MAGPSTSTASGGRCSARVLAFPRSTISAPYASWCRLLPTATPPWAWCTGCGTTSRMSLTTISPIPRRTVTAPCIPRWWVPRARCWKCRSAPTRCTRRRSWGSAPTGVTRAPRRAIVRPALTRKKSPGCGRCWTGTRRPAIPGTSPSSSVSRWPRTGYTCSPHRATW